MVFSMFFFLLTIMTISSSGENNPRSSCYGMFAEIKNLVIIAKQLLPISMLFFENDMYTGFNRITYSDLIDISCKVCIC